MEEDLTQDILEQPTTDEIYKISKQELIDSGVAITKKFILINSSLYEEDAFKYLLQLVDKSGAVAFISNTKKIWAQGQYFAGDIFKDEFNYFSKISISDSDDEIIETIETTKTQDQVRFRGIGNVYLYKSTKYVDLLGNVESTINIGYDINNSVDKSKFTLDPTSVYHLDTVDGKITMIKYTPCKVTFSSLTPIEFDSGDTTVSLKLTITGTDPLTVFRITSSLESIEFDTTDFVDNKIIKATVPNNTQVTFTVEYSDGTTNGTASVTQKWGYACLYGSKEITQLTIESIPNKYISPNSPANTIVINQNILENGWFACPTIWKPTFTDSSTNLQGGWEKAGKCTLYSNKTLYQIYKTTNTGLGSVKWIVGTK